MSDFRIQTCVMGMVSTNCYIVYRKGGKSAVIVDPADNGAYILNKCRELQVEPEAVLLTHGHFDHIMGIDGILEEYQVPVYVHEEEAELIQDPILNESNTYTNGYTFGNAEYTRDGQILELIGYKFRVIHTPGHTSGGVSYYVESENVLFSGDTLFHGSVGRTDFKTSSMSSLVHSIREKLFLLPDETVVYPGHMGATSIGTEKQINPNV